MADFHDPPTQSNAYLGIGCLTETERFERVEEDMHMVKTVIFGAPGSGKGTYASRLQSKLGVDIIATGDVFRDIMKENSQLGLQVKGFVEKGSLVPDNVVVEVLKHRIDKIPAGKGFILDGYPRTIEQAEALEEVAKIDVIIQLVVPDWIIVERLSTRRICQNCGEVYNIRYLKPKIDMKCDKCGGPLYQRPDDTPEVIKKRIEVYEKQTQPILEYYRQKGIPFVLFKTDSLETPPEVAVEEILEKLKKIDLV
jgi:adenylate kinase